MQWRERMWMAAFAAAMCVVAAGGGCSNDPVKAPPASRADLLMVDDYPRIVAMSNLHSWLAFSPATVTPATRSQPMHVSVPVRSLYDENSLNLQYRFEFFDHQGRPMRRRGGWTFVHVEPRVAVYLEGGAVDTLAADWRLEVRSAR